MACVPVEALCLNFYSCWHVLCCLFQGGVYWWFWCVLDMFLQAPASAAACCLLQGLIVLCWFYPMYVAVDCQECEHARARMAMYSRSRA
jgi:hypothetical protein